MTVIRQADARIRAVTKHLALGQHRIKCPLCHHTRQKNRSDRSLSVHVDDEGVQYRCWHCEAEGGWMGDEGEDWSLQGGLVPMAAPLPAPKRKADTGPTMSAVEYLVSRGIKEEVARKHTVEGEKYINGKMQAAVGFPYRNEEGEPTKWRALAEKGFTQTGACRHFYLQETHRPGNAILICEGELDALAWLSADLPDSVTVLSIPNGAPIKLSDGKPDNQSDTKFRYLWEARDIIERAPRIYINCDNDGPGKVLEQELLRRIHNPRRFVVRLGEHKDAADCLSKEGPSRLREYFEEASRPATRGIHRASEYVSQILDAWESGWTEQKKTGLASVDLYTSFAPGMVTTLTGYPGSGKSNFIDQIFVNMGREHGWKSLMVNNEKQPRRHIPELVMKLKGEHWRSLPRAEVEDAIAWIDKHMFFIDRSDKAAPDDIVGILEEASKMVMQEGIRLLSIDPYNYLSRQGDAHETEYVRFMMKAIADWSKQHDCHTVLVAHPQKPENRMAANKFPPKGYDISGSANFFNATDLGITMHRDDDDQNWLHVWKVRFSDLGQLGRVKLGYNPTLGIWYDLPDWRIVGEFHETCNFPPLSREVDDPSTESESTP